MKVKRFLFLIRLLCAFVFIFSISSCYRKDKTLPPPQILRQVPIIYEMSGVGNATGRIVTDYQIYTPVDLKKVSEFEILELHLIRGKAQGAQEGDILEILESGDSQDKINIYVDSPLYEENYSSQTLLQVAQRKRLELYVSSYYYSTDSLKDLYREGGNLYFLNKAYSPFELKQLLNTENKTVFGSLTFYIQDRFLSVSELIDFVKKGVRFKLYSDQYVQNEILEVALEALKSKVPLTLYLTQNSHYDLFILQLLEFLGVDLEFLEPLLSEGDFRKLADSKIFQKPFFISYLQSFIQGSVYQAPFDDFWRELLESLSKERHLKFYVSSVFPKELYQDDFWEFIAQYGAKLIFLNYDFSLEQYERLLGNLDNFSVQEVFKKQKVEIAFSDLPYFGEGVYRTSEELKRLKNSKLILFLSEVSENPLHYSYEDLKTLSSFYKNNFYAFLPNDPNPQTTLSFDAIGELTQNMSSIFTYEENIIFGFGENPSHEFQNFSIKVDQSYTPKNYFLFWNGSFVHSLNYNYTKLSRLLEKYQVNLMMHNRQQDLNYYHPKGLKSVAKAFERLGEKSFAQGFLEGLRGSDIELFYKGESFSELNGKAIGAHMRNRYDVPTIQLIYSYSEFLYAVNERTVIHEMAHGYDLKNYSQLGHSTAILRNHLFTGGEGEGFITEYSRTNTYEDFAEHVSYFVVYPSFFRQLMQFDTRLRSKYNFIRDFIFGGFEFS